jgi:hypothetical protein
MENSNVVFSFNKCYSIDTNQIEGLMEENNGSKKDKSSIIGLCC